MREDIGLFRGFETVYEEWKYGFLHADYMIETKKGRAYFVDKDTISEYAGVDDKNGTKIFEGDIIKVEYHGWNKGLEGVAAVIFKNGKFGLEWGNKKELVCFDAFHNVTFEVIGNIYKDAERAKEMDA